MLFILLFFVSAALMHKHTHTRTKSCAHIGEHTPTVWERLLENMSHQPLEKTHKYQHFFLMV